MSVARKVTVTEFEQQPASVLRRVRRGEIIEITSHGRTVAHVTPADPDEVEGELVDPEGAAREAMELAGMFRSDRHVSLEEMEEAIAEAACESF